MNKSVFIIFILVLAALSAYAGFYFHQQSNTDVELAEDELIKPEAVSVIGKPMPEISLKDLDGVEQSLQQWSGKVLAINFWATWCPPCREEIPDFLALQDQYGEQGLQFVGIALQYPDELKAFLEEIPITYPLLAGGTEVVKAATALGNGIGALPYTVIIDRDGVIQFSRKGKLSKSEAESVILPLL